MNLDKSITLSVTLFKQHARRKYISYIMNDNNKAD